MAYTFSDGLTLAGTNVTNDLVTGAEVAHVNAQTAGGAEFQLKDDGSVLLKGAAALGRLEIDPVGEVALVSAAAKDLFLTAGANLVLEGATIGLTSGSTPGNDVAIAAPAGPLSLTASGNLVATAGAGNGLSLSGGGVNINAVTNSLALAAVTTASLTAGSDASVNANPSGAGALSLNAGSTGGSATLNTNGTGDFNANINHDEIHTVGRNFSIGAAGSTGVTISASHATGKVVLDVSDTGEVRIMPTGSAPAATKLLRFWNGAGSGQADGTTMVPSGGSTVDTEARTALGALVTALFGWGLVSNPTP